MSRTGFAMADGRAFTSYLSPGISHARLAEKLGVDGAGGDDFRLALQANPAAARPKMVARKPPRVPVRPTDPGADVRGVTDTAPVACAPGFFPRVL